MDMKLEYRRIVIAAIQRVGVPFDNAASGIAMAEGGAEYVAEIPLMSY